MRNERLVAVSVEVRLKCRRGKSLSSFFVSPLSLFCNGHFAFLPRSRPLNGFELNGQPIDTETDEAEEEEDKEARKTRRMEHFCTKSDGKVALRKRETSV